MPRFQVFNQAVSARISVYEAFDEALEGVHAIPAPRADAAAEHLSFGWMAAPFDKRKCGRRGVPRDRNQRIRTGLQRERERERESPCLVSLALLPLLTLPPTGHVRQAFLKLSEAMSACEECMQERDAEDVAKPMAKVTHAHALPVHVALTHAGTAAGGQA